ncbi:MAG TPA: YidC/Oxa1 family membrane protein insertase, partial [Treponemataceae bacterium]|nr:YidC/Oxa1 family membrane protein insertase [Treponemataceae bacterium]
MTSILSFILTPFTFVIFVLFEQAVSLTGNYGISLVIVSFCITAGTAPLYLLADAWKNSETRLKNTMFDDIESIKNHYSGNKRFYLTKTAHRIYGYTPWQSLKTSLGLLIQIPFFFAAYEVLSHYTGYSGVSFFIVEDLAQPDGLLHGINLLPFVMTGINLVSAFYYSRSFSFKQNRSLVIMSLAFLLLLYNSPAALLIYWTMNNVFSFIKAIIFRKTGLQSIPVAILSSKKSDSVIKKMIHTY